LRKSGHPVKPNPKKWVGSDNWVDVGLKKEKLTQKLGFREKPDPTKKIN
jgi:hypothetical protein